jgi:hypothetical protein
MSSFLLPSRSIKSIFYKNHTCMKCSIMRMHEMHLSRIAQTFNSRFVSTNFFFLLRLQSFFARAIYFHSCLAWTRLSLASPFRFSFSRFFNFSSFICCDDDNNDDDDDYYCTSLTYLSLVFLLARYPLRLIEIKCCHKKHLSRKHCRECNW